MATVAAQAHEILVPYVGEMVADTCVRATALSLGKTSDTLGPDDLPDLENSIRRLLAPVAPSAVIDSMLDQLSRAATQ